MGNVLPNFAARLGLPSILYIIARGFGSALTTLFQHIMYSKHVAVSRHSNPVSSELWLLAELMQPYNCIGPYVRNLKPDVRLTSLIWPVDKAVDFLHKLL